jgi:hypothetical protein
VEAAYSSEMIVSTCKTSRCPNTEDHNLKYKKKKGKKENNRKISEGT